MERESELVESYYLKYNEKLVVDTIRKMGDKISSKNTISEITGIPWSSVSNILKSLQERKILNVTQGDDKKTDEIYSVNADYGYFAGISLGTSRIKVVILDYCFNPLKALPITSESIDTKYRDEVDLILTKLMESEGIWKICCDKQFNSLNGYISFLSAVVDILCFLKKRMKVNILAVNVVLPGSIDFDKQIIINSYILENMMNISCDKFLTERNMKELSEAKILYSLDHNAKATIVAEKYFSETLNQDDTNLMCLYLGYGIGASFIFNNQLYRGNRNESGQIGHNQVIPRKVKAGKILINDEVDETKLCRCGRKHCLEHRIREDVFKIDNPQGQSTEEMATILDNPERLKLFTSYLGEALCNVLDNLAIDKIILSGKFCAIFDCIVNELNEILLLNKFSNVKFLKSNLSEYSAAYGACINAYDDFYKKCKL